MLLGDGVSEEQDFLMGLVGVAVLVEVVLAHIRVEDMSGCHKVDTVGVARIVDKKPPIPPMDGVSLVEME